MAIDAQRPPALAPIARPRPKREREEEVLVWPDLVFVEFISAVLFTITFLMLSVFINAPLLNRANIAVTPNPSKAPWYFLNLQELLLHMEKGWAGVLLPTIALGFFASIPYLDRSREAQGVWFGTKYAGRLTVIAAIYAVIVSFGLVMMDAGDRNVFPSQLIPGEGPTFRTEQLTRWIPGCSDSTHQGLPCLRDAEGADHQGFVIGKEMSTRLELSFPFPNFLLDLISNEKDEEEVGGVVPGCTQGALCRSDRDGHLDWPRDIDHVPVPFNNVDCCYGSLHLWKDMHLNIPSIIAEQVMPLSTIVFFAVLIIYILFRLGWVRTRRDVFIIMFTSVMASYLTLSMVGSFFRGEGQALIPPWEIKVDEG
jgi:hypothetical protein